METVLLVRRSDGFQNQWWSCYEGESLWYWPGSLKSLRYFFIATFFLLSVWTKVTQRCSHRSFHMHKRQVRHFYWLRNVFLLTKLNTVFVAWLYMMLSWYPMRILWNWIHMKKVIYAITCETPVRQLYLQLIYWTNNQVVLYSLSIWIKFIF